MKILLINPSFDYYSKYLLTLEPLSLGYLAAYLKNHGYEVSILDAQAGSIIRKAGKWHYGLPDHEAVERIKKFKPDLVGITSPFSLINYPLVHTARLVKKIDNRITTVAGGMHPTIFPLETVNYKEIDYVIIGEGERSFLSLLKYIESNMPEACLDGCAYKKDNGTKLVPKKDFIEDLDKIPFPDRDLLPMEFYVRKKTALYGLGSRRSSYIITSRGCQHRCNFCNAFLSNGPRWRPRSAQNVFEEIKLLLEKYRIEEIFFMDDNLTFDRERIIKLCGMILSKGLKFRWNTPNGVEARSLDTELAGIMKKAGCVNVCIGVEAGNERIRNTVIGKGLSENCIHKALNACKKVGLPVVGFFILGIPGENKHTFKDSISMIEKMPFRMIATSFYTPFPNTRLYDDCLEKGYIKKDYYRYIHRFGAPVVETPDFDNGLLRKWEKEIYFKFCKSHFWNLLWETVTLKNYFFQPALLRRFVKEKFNI